jgi:hypothetical protein
MSLYQRSWISVPLATWDLYDCFALQDNGVSNLAFAQEFNPLPWFAQIDHLDGGVDGIANLHGREESQSLRDVDRAWTRQSRADDGRDKAGGIKAMSDTALERRFRRKMLREVNGVPVSCNFGESHDIRRLDGFGVGFDHSQAQILEKQGPEGQ